MKTICFLIVLIIFIFNHTIIGAPLRHRKTTVSQSNVSPASTLTTPEANGRRKEIVTPENTDRVEEVTQNAGVTMTTVPPVRGNRRKKLRKGTTLAPASTLTTPEANGRRKEIVSSENTDRVEEVTQNAGVTMTTVPPGRSPYQWNFYLFSLSPI
ncbi:hypothetical protein XELAEV_18023670mg [Xenopus laevis]|uniref:Uncharacterized protein n=1 Tax=Xenopus laevis TaxID=8355 RepID=A0A974HPW0_XENLA|nr:hypothetical protein XELAEV_18023670mg [Xenopus laevis]